jgi:hypothetical protein
MPAKIHKNGSKNGQFPTLIDLKIAENTVFHSKIPNKIYSQFFFKEYINFKIFHYLRQCGVIPVQNFGSHVHP